MGGKGIAFVKDECMHNFSQETPTRRGHVGDLEVDCYME
jgi:hypothetical protein